MIQTTLTGALGRDATLKALEKGNVINFSIGVSVGYGDKKTTLWVDASYFTDKTGITPYLLKGTKVLVVGEPGIRMYTKSDGTTAAVVTLRVREVELIGGKVEAAPAQAAPQANNITEPIDDLPF
jgi:single-strand DNA-binding protein